MIGDSGRALFRVRAPTRSRLVPSKNKIRLLDCLPPTLRGASCASLQTMGLVALTKPHHGASLPFRTFARVDTKLTNTSMAPCSGGTLSTHKSVDHRRTKPPFPYDAASPLWHNRTRTRARTHARMNARTHTCTHGSGQRGCELLGRMRVGEAAVARR